MYRFSWISLNNKVQKKAFEPWEHHSPSKQAEIFQTILQERRKTNQTMTLHNAHKATRQEKPQTFKVNNTYQNQNRQIQQHFSHNMEDNILQHAPAKENGKNANFPNKLAIYFKRPHYTNNCIEQQSTHQIRNQSRYQTKNRIFKE